MALGVSPLRGAGLLRFASRRRQRPSVSPLTGGHPSRKSVSPAEPAGTRRPFPVPGDRGPRFLHAARERGPLGALTGLQVAALRFARCGAGQIATPVTRHARSRAAEVRLHRSARSRSTAAPVAALGGTSAAEPPLLVNIRSASPQPLRQASWHIVRDAAPPAGSGSPCASRPTAPCQRRPPASN